ncbi:glycosyl hydrolase [Winogradskyella sp. PC-19]|uniref:VPS10 domain-containing protein n=1 Tax=unclassified Winogradskyella TaxID=2615021 RepID=UPI000B3BFC05|nr:MULTISPECIES: glycosyl hydrolase [unclassified Winogradskyella]ARV09846.1 glycosyl hydrolase [Winogradskyella sp. PC-19]RZN83278.1 MAG: glycosyl hydrolase [Winogradskyella sp.]
MNYSKLLGFILSLSSVFAIAQQPATSAETVKNALIQKRQLTESSLVKNVPFKNIGPTIMSGRVVDVDVNPDMPSEFYVGYASGGVWYTTNNGTTFEPILDSSDTQNVGDIAVHWPTRTIYVGTGENNASRSSYAGIGILKSTDNGKNWTNVGLMDAHHFAPILIHPENPDVVTVGVTGHLYSANNERGIYKTTDGGKTWKQTLFVDDMSGIIDLQHSPKNYDVMFATSWTKDRKAWNFTGNGNNSAIYKSTDAGDTWTRVSTKSSGFPTGEGVGRIGVAVFDDNTIYAVHDSQFRRPDEKKKSDRRGLTKDDFKSMSNGDFLALEDKKLNAFLKTNGFQEKYRAENVKQMVRSGNVKPIDLAKYLEDANSMLFDTPVVGAEVYKSTDGGKTWKKTHDDYLDGIYFSYGYYFGHIHVSPVNADAIYIYGVPIVKSKDGGKTFTSISAENVHADHHALWINPKNPNHLVNGNDGGVNITYDDGENWIKNNSPSVGQFYAINVDNEKPYNVYGGLQDNGVWKGANNARENKAWHQQGQYPWKSIMGGDGMQIQIDNRNSDIVYTGFQFGNYYRLNLETGDRRYIQPKHTLGENPYRFNWQTPILLSPHNQDILYLGGNKLMRSMNQGNDWEAISDDLTNGGKKGNVAYGTLASISESPFQFGLIYTGSDDGLVHVTKNAGGSWTNISSSLPKDLWVSRVVASEHKKERVYVTLNGYRWDDFSVYVYMSDNYGQTWENISGNIPASPVNVIREDSENENILYIGTDNGAYVSFNQGETWDVFSNGVPNVAVHDIVLQSDAKDVLLGTHGRSIYKASIAPLQKMNADMNSKAITLFDMNPMRYSSRWGSSWSQWLDAYEPETTIQFFSNASGEKAIKILSEKGAELNSMKVIVDKGFNYVDYNLELTNKGRKALMKENTSLDINQASNGKYYLPKGEYTVEIDGAITKLEIK